MSEHILLCKRCSRYTMHETCHVCGDKTVSVVPAKYSPHDLYGKYRRQVKHDELKKKGWL
ncbi:RNA-protein complex protein Nop10 [Candidatus Woesearchaeota archaeon]|nr:RNA-protein complex protein Nop10 [Candidatus Woesearchaeota archaeon]